MTNHKGNDMSNMTQEVHARIKQERANAIARHELNGLLDSRLGSGRPVFMDELTDASSYDDRATVEKIARLIATLSEMDT